MSDKSKLAVKVYDKITEKYAKTFTNPSDFIDKFILLLPKGGKVLDVGCGPGQDTAYLASKRLAVEGMDLSPNMIKFAKKRFPNIKFTVMDMRKLDYPNNYFDGLFVSFSLIHVPQKEVDKTMSEFERVLKPDGVIYLGLQEGDGEVFQKEPLDPNEKMFLKLFDTDEIKSLIEKYGFEVIFVKSIPFKKKEEFEYNKLFIIAKKSN